MSWLLVGFIPGLLMAATFGLERLESNLHRDGHSAGYSPRDVATFLSHAQAAEVGTLARDGMGRALDSLARRLHEQDSTVGGFATTVEPAGLPTRVYAHEGANPGFQPTRLADRV